MVDLILDGGTCHLAVDHHHQEKQHRKANDMKRTFGLLMGAAVLVGLARAAEFVAPTPPIRKPVMFDTPEADKILAALQVFPPDNPWNQDVSRWPVHPNSRNIIAAIGADKPLRHNSDMGFVLVPPRTTPAA